VKRSSGLGQGPLLAVQVPRIAVFHVEHTFPFAWAEAPPV